MRTLTVVMAVFCLSACGGNETEKIGDRASMDSETPSSVQLSNTDILRVCKAGAAFRNGRSVQGIEAEVTDEQQVRLAYTRDADGKHFEYDCLVEGNVLRFRMIDEAGPGTGPGRWSGQGSKTTFKLNPTSVELTDDFFDGSSDSDIIDI